MKLDEIGEFGLIDRIRRTYASASRKAPIGIGDDAAALFFSSSSTVLVTTDLLIEGVHFDLATTDPYSLGWKASAANLSDIAAMGGVPRFSLVGLGLPRRITLEQVNAFYRGFTTLGRKHRTLLVGGDTCRSEHDLLISVTMLGDARKRHIITRSGALPGDLVFVTGTLGDSAAGLEILTNAQRGTSPGTGGTRSQRIRALVDRHLRPVPRVAWGKKLAAMGGVSAMIDVSDGLSSDLAHICRESGVGALVHAAAIPMSRDLQSVEEIQRKSLDYALSGGEDYELLFTVRPNKAGALGKLDIPVTRIGVITKDRIMALVDTAGRRRPLVATGYQHFSAVKGKNRRKR